MPKRSAITAPYKLLRLLLLMAAATLAAALPAGLPAQAQGVEPAQLVERAIRDDSNAVLALFSPRMRALLEAEMKKDDGIGLTWIAGGNDEPKVTALKTEVLTQAGDAATVQATFRNYGDARRRTFMLVRSGGRWLIDDARTENNKLISAQLRGTAQPPRRWLPTSNTAISITGPVTISDDSIRFGGKTLKVTLVDANRAGRWSDVNRQQTLSARLYKATPPSELTLLRGNTLCGRPVTFIATFSPTPSDLFLNAYSGSVEPRGNQPADGFCGFFVYGAQ